jgi:hypothetical protein
MAGNLRLLGNCWSFINYIHFSILGSSFEGSNLFPNLSVLASRALLSLDTIKAFAGGGPFSGELVVPPLRPEAPVS